MSHPAAHLLTLCDISQNLSFVLILSALQSAGAKVDAWLAACGGQWHTSLCWVMLRRYHHKMTFLLHFPASNASAGAKVDAWLAARGGQRHTFSRSVVLRRYHHNMGAWENLRYRWRLLRVRKL